MPRFVLLRHECPPDWKKPSHWDFMLEADSVLWTWELRELPAAWATALGMESASFSPSVFATRIADHRLAYLDYAGAVSDNRGSVSRLDAGTFEWLLQSPQILEVELVGRHLHGAVTLMDKHGAWELCF